MTKHTCFARPDAMGPWPVVRMKTQEKREKAKREINRKQHM